MYDAMPTVTTLPTVRAINPTHPLTGRYTARIQDVDCELVFRLDHTGRLVGTFSAEDERLEVIGRRPNSLGEVTGAILDPEGEILAVFRAVPDVLGLDLALDTPQTQHLMRFAQAEHVRFTAVR